MATTTHPPRDFAVLPEQEVVEIATYNTAPSSSAQGTTTTTTTTPAAAAAASSASPSPSQAPVPRLRLEAFVLHPDGRGDYRFRVSPSPSSDSHAPGRGGGTVVDDDDDDDDTTEQQQHRAAWAPQIKYITVEAGALPSYHRQRGGGGTLVNFPCQHRVVGAALPSPARFPPGAWNVRHIVACPRTHQPVFGPTALEALPSVRNVWHETVLAHDDLVPCANGTGRFRQNVGLVTCPQFRGRVVYKWAAFPWMVARVEHETTAYQVLTRHRRDKYGAGSSATTGARRSSFWAPRFLGHVREAGPPSGGRVVGFLLEYIPGRRPDVGSVRDAELCAAALGKLHGAGLVHGRVDLANFIIRRRKKGDEALLIDFAHTVASEHESEIVEEMADLEEAMLGGRERSGSPSLEFEFPDDDDLVPSRGGRSIM